jgi:hypothetical protein
MPIGIPKHETLDGWYYWYDFIDNFTKHNRYSEAERQAVRESMHLSKIMLSYSPSYRTNVFTTLLLINNLVQKRAC